MDKTSQRFAEEKETLEVMFAIYCEHLHRGKDGLCPDCAPLLKYALEKLDKCTFGGDKPTCAKCHIHCYNTEMRERIRNIMKYSGPRMLRSHPVMALKHLMRGILHKPSQKT